MKLIKDIRYYEARDVPRSGASFSVPAGSLYRLPRATATLGQRIAAKLRELEVSMGAFDHLYIVFTPAIGPEDVVVTGWGSEPWFRYVASGLSDTFNELPDSEKLELVTRRTFAALRSVCPNAEPALARVEGLLRELGDALQIQLLRHSTRELEIELSYTVAAFGERPSQGWISITERATGRTARAPFVELRFFDDIFFLAKRVSVKGRTVTIYPRRSERADLTTSPYTTPIVVDIDSVLAR